jgi:hypothetical protein
MMKAWQPASIPFLNVDFEALLDLSYSNVKIFELDNEGLNEYFREVTTQIA